MARMRLAELIGTLSLAVDAGTGLPDHHSLRGATLAVGLARELKADDRTVQDAFYLPLLAMAGCTAESHASASMLGDEVGIGTESYGLDWGNPREMLPVMLRLVRRGHSPLGGLAAVVRAFGRMSSAREVGRAHCEVAAHLAERFGFDDEFRAALFQAFERWDGTGKPLKVKGEAIAAGMRIALVAIDANIGHRLGGVEGAIAFTRKHAKRGLDPNFVERFTSAAARLCAPLDEPSPWATALAAEPEPWRQVSEEGVDEGLLAMAHFSDLKCRFTRAHSTGVSTCEVGSNRQASMSGLRAGHGQPARAAARPPDSPDGCAPDHLGTPPQERQSCPRTSNFCDPLTDILLCGGSGMRTTGAGGSGLFAPGAGEDCPFPGAAATPAHLRARVDRQVRRPHAARLRHRRATRLHGLRRLGAGLRTTLVQNLPRTVCGGLELQRSRLLSELRRQTHERGRVDSGRSRFARHSHPSLGPDYAVSLALSARVRRRIAGPSPAHLHRHRDAVVSPAPG